MATIIAGGSARDRLRSFFVCTLTALGLAACGGGGGGGSPPPPPSVAFSTTNITFNATSPWSARPANQVLTGTVTGGISGNLFIIVEVNNPEIAGAQNVTVISDTQGQGIIVPVLPSTLGSGTHTGTLTVRVCLNSPTCATGNLVGSPRTINLTYIVPSAVERDTVTPYVVNTGFTGRVILRGTGFAANTTVSFGGVAAAAVEFASSTELRVTPPASVINNANTYAVQLNGGALAFTGNLLVVDPTVFPATFLAHPEGQWFPFGLEYDPGSRALLLSGAAGNALDLRRYLFNAGGWSAPQSAAGPLPALLRQLRMSHDGSRLLALSYSNVPIATAIHEYDPVTLAIGASTSLVFDPVNPAFAESFALANDGSLILQAGSGGGSNYPIRFDTVDRVFTHLVVERDVQFVAMGSGNGSVVLMQTGNQRAIRYNASNATITRASGSPPMNTCFNQCIGQGSASLTGDRIQSGTGIADVDFLALGFANNASGPIAGVINRAGTRFYVYEVPGATAQLRTYDLTATPAGNPPLYPEIGMPSPLAGNPGISTALRMTITPDGGTVFIAGPSGIAVQPTP